MLSIWASGKNKHFKWVDLNGVQLPWGNFAAVGVPPNVVTDQILLLE